MTRIPRISLLSLSLVALFCLTASAQVRTPLGDFRWDRYQEEKKLTREQAVAKHNYCPTSGCVIRLDEIQLSPSSARRGDTMILTTTYTLLTAEDTPIPISITREMFYQGKSLGVTKALQTRNLNGTWTQKIEFPLAKDATPGIYTLVTRINTGYGRDEKSVQFAVQ
jgi:hypothetical protein